MYSSYFLIVLKVAYMLMIQLKGGDLMDILKNGSSFFCRALVWFITALSMLKIINTSV
ncbi:hypothetical protein GKD08_11435 [Paeniclostridium sordellii]|uniref:hypothetical protein n=1 Tax=Paraclostridium sordellii TaxID=1505 RepID=UPI0012D837FA|nr:hypothetical protein [Paeniclostridium sordellii]MDU4412761.1 hypothetical protein [Paeniclostridium sordellii]MRZ29369.1 hypothetical protein [Paeniclostridium sordellii]